MITTKFANPESLAELTALVERTLIDTGRLFRKSGSMPASTHLQRSIPAYYDGFQNALDNLSEQIFIAKAILEKDYEAIKAREAVPQPAEDVSMSGVDEKAEINIETTNLEQQNLTTQPVKVESTSDDTAVANISAATEAHPLHQPSEPAPEIEERKPENASQVDQTLDGTTEGIKLQTGGNQGGANNSFDLDYDFGNDDMGNQAFLSGTAFAGTTTGSDKASASGAPTDNEAMVPTGGGAFDMELGKGNNSFPDTGTGMDDMMGPGESSFDDLFLENENMGGNPGNLHQLEGDSLMGMNELDDSWFN